MLWRKTLLWRPPANLAGTLLPRVGKHSHMELREQCLQSEDLVPFQDPDPSREQGEEIPKVRKGRPPLTCRAYGPLADLWRLSHARIQEGADSEVSKDYA